MLRSRLATWLAALVPDLDDVARRRRRRHPGRVGYLRRQLVDPSRPGPDPLLTLRRGALPKQAEALLDWQRRHRDAVLQVTKTALAAALAWEIAVQLVGSPQPVLAPLSALLTVQVTVYQTVAAGIGRVLGMVAGVGVALAFAWGGGLHGWTIALAMGCALALARLVTVGGGASIEAPVTALIVMGIAAQESVIAYRILDTLVGAAVGVVVNLLLVPPTHLGTAGKALGDLAYEIGDLLRDMADDLVEDYGPDLAGRWLRRARKFNGSVRTVREAVERGQESLRWNPRGRRRRDLMPSYDEALTTLEHVAVQVRGISRALRDAAQAYWAGEGPLPSERFRVRFSNLLAAAGDAVEAYGRPFLLRLEHGETLRPADIDESVAAARAGVRDLVAETHEQVRDPDLFVLYGSLLGDVSRVLDELVEEVPGPLP